MQGKPFATKCAWCDSIKMGQFWLPKPFSWMVLISTFGRPYTHSICQKCLKSQFRVWHQERMGLRVSTGPPHPR